MHGSRIGGGKGDDSLGYAEGMADVFLEPQQERLLGTFVEAARSLPPERRKPFLFNPVMQRPNRVEHPGLPNGAIDVYRGDWEALAAEGLLRVSPTSSKNVLRIEVTPRGFQHYSETKVRSEPVE